MAIKDDPIIKEFEHQVGIKVLEYSYYMSKGKCASFEDYKKRSGVVIGLELALDILSEVIKNYGKEDDES